MNVVSPFYKGMSDGQRAYIRRYKLQQIVALWKAREKCNTQIEKIIAELSLDNERL